MKEEMVVGLSAPGPVGRWGAAPPQALLERMKDYGQEGAFALWDDLSPEDRELLVRDIAVSNNARCFGLCRGRDFAFRGKDLVFSWNFASGSVLALGLSVRMLL
jgi:hypothetical protein